MQTYKLSATAAADSKDQKSASSVNIATTQIFNLQKQLDAINGDAKFTLLDLSRQKVCDETSKPKLTKTMSEETARARFAMLYNQKMLCTILDDGGFNSGFKLWDLKDTKSNKSFLPQKKNIVELIVDFAVLDDNKLVTYTYQINAKSREETGCSSIKVWDTNTWESTTLKEEKAFIFSTTGSGLCALPNRQLLSFIEEKTLKLWDIDQQKCLHVYNNFDKAVAVFPNSNFAYSSSDKIIHVCTGGDVYKTLKVKRAVTALSALSNTQLAIGVAGNILIWDLQTNKLSTLCQLDSNRDVNKLAVLPDGRLASCQEGSVKYPMAFIQLWNIQTGECTSTLTSSNKKDRGVEQLTVLQDGRLINSWYCDGNKPHGITEWTFDYRALKLADIRPLLEALKNNRSVTQLNLQQVAIDDKAIPELAKLAQQNLTLVELDLQNTLVSKAGIKELYNLTRKRLPTLKIKHAAMDAILQEEGMLQKSIVPVSTATAAAVVDAKDQKSTASADTKCEAKLDKTLQGHSSTVFALTLLGDGRLASGSGDKSIKLWDVKTGQCVQTLQGHSSYVYALTLLGDGRLASGSEDKSIKLWDVQTGQCVQTLQGHSNGVTALTLLGDGRLASGSTDNSIKLWDVQTGQCVQTLQGHSSTVCALTLLGDGRLASGSYDESIKLWDVQTGQCVQTLQGHSSYVAALTVLGDGRLASGSYDKSIKLWDVQTGQCVQTLQGHSGGVKALTLLGDGRLASGSYDKSIKLWNVQTGQCVQTLQGHSGYVYALTLLGDGRLASGFSDGSIKLWDVGARTLQLQAAAKIKAEEEAKLKAERETKEKAEKEAKEKAEQDKLMMKDQKLADKDKELAELRAKLQQLELQQTKPAAPAAGLSVSFEIPYNELQYGNKLGAGGFGIVYKGTWRFQNVAIKELLDEKPSAAAAADFKNEMQVMAKLRSSNVVQFYGCVLGNPKYCIVMEYMPKGSLFNLLRSNQTLDWSTRYKMTLDMACGLAFLHAENILHRDLKSLNVLLDENYHAKLTDFGLSKVKTETRTTTKNQSVGSEGWTAPELTEPEASYTPKCDVFSMGITFWEIATRKIPYEKTANRSFISFWFAQNKREEIPADCPPKMAYLIKWCWDTDPSKRPTAAEAVKYLRDAESDFKLGDNKPNQNDNAAQVNNLASASFAATYQMNTPVVKK